MSLFPTTDAYNVSLNSSTVVNDAPGYCRKKWFTPSGYTNQVWQDQVRAINKTGGTLVVGGLYILSESNTAGEEWQIVTAAALASVPRTICVATTATLNNAFGDVVIRGHASALVEGTTDVAAADRLKLAPGTFADAFIKDSAETVSSAGKSCAAQTDNSKVLTLVILHGKDVVVNT